MATPPPVTDRLARFVTETEFSTIPEPTRTSAKLHILDTFGAALAGVDQLAPRIALDYCAKLGASREASIWGPTQKAAVRRRVRQGCPASLIR